MNVVITGASRGIGLELTKLALENGDHVVALVRNPEKSAGLQALAHKFPQNLKISPVELTEPQSFVKAEAAVSQLAGIDILINNAGILATGDKREDFQKSFLMNSIVPYELTSAMLPKLRASKDAKLIHITSLMGSVADNSSGGSVAYRASKSALNMINKCISAEHSWLTAIVIHPGWVKTDMGGSNAPIEIQDSAQGIWNVIHKAKRSNSGHFFDFRGKELPW